MHIECKFKVVVEKIGGKCTCNYSEGQPFEFHGLYTPEGFCGAAYHAMFPILYALHVQPDTLTATGKEKNVAYFSCPENGKVKFKIIKLDTRTVAENPLYRIS